MVSFSEVLAQRPRLLFCCLLFAAHAAAHSAESAHPLNLEVGKIRKLDDVGAPIADIHFGNEPLPQYGTIISYVAPSLLIAYIMHFGLIVSSVYALLNVLFLTALYVITALSFDYYDNVSIAHYAIINMQPVLTNRGAVGGTHFAWGLLGLHILAAVLGVILSWIFAERLTAATRALGARSTVANPQCAVYKMDNIMLYVEDSCCASACCASACCKSNCSSGPRQKACDDDCELLRPGCAVPQPVCGPEGVPLVVERTFFATSAGQRITWGVLCDHVGIVSAAAVATGPLRDLWRDGRWDWIGTAALIVFAFLIMCVFYVVYRFDDVIAVPCSDTWYWRAYLARLLLGPPFLALVVFHIVMSSVYTELQRGGNFGLIEISQDAHEAIEFATMNNLIILLAAVGTLVGLQLVALACYWKSLSHPMLIE